MYDIKTAAMRHVPLRVVIQEAQTLILVIWDKNGVQLVAYSQMWRMQKKKLFIQQLLEIWNPLLIAALFWCGHRIYMNELNVKIYKNKSRFRFKREIKNKIPNIGTILSGLIYRVKIE